jgi:exopolysaccharide biosynthesis polyprenyl glycosylphosphotransferase
MLMVVRSRTKGRPWGYLKPCTDALLAFAAFGLSYWIRYELQWIRQVEPEYVVPFGVYMPAVAAVTGIIIIMYWVEGAYRPDHTRSFFDELYIAFRGALGGIAAIIVLVFLATPGYYSRLIFGYSGVITFLLIGISRTVELVLRRHRYRQGIGVIRVLIVGAGEVARSIMRSVVARPELGYKIVGYVDDDPAKAYSEIGRFPGLGTTADACHLVKAHAIDELIIALPGRAHQKIAQIADECDRQNTRVRIVPDLFRIASTKMVVENLDGIPIIGVGEPALRDWQVVLKRAIDVAFSVAGLILLAPLMAIIAVAIKLDSEGPVIFRQVRVGRIGRTFTCYKFRTMCPDAETQAATLSELNEASGPLFKMRDDPRMTRVGRIIRRGLDELPQFWNVLRGEMSLIGPRPGLPSEVARYQPWHRRRLEVSPGITGLWQVSGRSDLTFDEMVLLDIYYIENWSPLLDLRILLRTIPTVLWGVGAY